jgi:polysaccharide deacetylase family protein (PEP-CTERM system associated)
LRVELMKNALSIDLEDWFCAHNLCYAVKRGDWDKCELRAYESTKLVLSILERHNTRATFFVLGWIAERLPGLVREIEERGHEIAIHGYDHLLLTEITPAEFEDDLVRALDAVKACGIRQRVSGFRAPSFTIVKKTQRWALQILEKHRFEYDSSIFPVGFHPDYGVASAPLTPYRITERLYEFPMSCLDMFGVRFPFSGGGYFRLFPYAYTKYFIKRCNRSGRPAMFYLHPWELDSGQPRKSLPLTKRVRHYRNLGKTRERLNALLTDFQFTTVREVLGL